MHLFNFASRRRLPSVAWLEDQHNGLTLQMVRCTPKLVDQDPNPGPCLQSDPRIFTAYRQTAADMIHSDRAAEQKNTVYRNLRRLDSTNSLFLSARPFEITPHLRGIPEEHFACHLFLKVSQKG